LYLGGNVRDDLLVALDNLAAIDLATGRLTAFRPQLTKYQTIGHIVVSQNHVLASGEFSTSLG
jgi:hypothetical protein